MPSDVEGGADSRLAGRAPPETPVPGAAPPRRRFPARHPGGGRVTAWIGDIRQDLEYVLFTKEQIAQRVAEVALR